MSLTVIFGLLTFLLAFFALAAKERKTPYIVQSIYSTCIIILSVFLFSMIADFYDDRMIFIPEIDWWAIGRHILVILVGLYALHHVARIRNQHIYFRDDRMVFNLLIFQKIKSIYRKWLTKPIYEHNACKIPSGVMSDIESDLVKLGISAKDFQDVKQRHEKSDLYALSAGWKAASMRQADHVLSALAATFLHNECYVQYTSCARHPLEFVLRFKEYWESTYKPAGGGEHADWKTIVASIVVVDAYSPHFGFTDSILDISNQRLTKEGVHIVHSSTTYAGIHSASSVAFNKFKIITDSPARPATLVIYECPYALVDVESPEQYRVFLRHVLPSERMWGGMMTVFLETAIEQNELDLLKSYLDIYAELDSNND